MNYSEVCFFAPALALACAHAHELPPSQHATSPPATRAVASSIVREPGVDVENEGIPPDPVSHELPAGESAPPEPTHDFQKPLPSRELDKASAAMLASNLSPSACLAELRRRKLPVERDTGAAAGISVPVRVTGPMHGVRFLSPGRKSVYGKLDCRLALALDELAAVLERHGVAALRVDNLYRPRARLPGRRTPSQHRYGLAIDIVAVELTDGTELSVERDWLAPLDTPPCGPESRLVEPTAPAIALRDIACDIARSGLFHHILTPSYNEAHRDHVHLDIKRGEKRSVIE